MSRPTLSPTLIEVEPASLLTLSTGEEITVPFGEIVRLDIAHGQAVLTLLETERVIAVPAALLPYLLDVLGVEPGAA